MKQRNVINPSVLKTPEVKKKKGTLKRLPGRVFPPNLFLMEIRYETNNEISHIKYLKYLVVLQTEWETRSNRFQVEPGSGASLAWTLFLFLSHFVADIKKKTPLIPKNQMFFSLPKLKHYAIQG